MSRGCVGTGAGTGTWLSHLIRLSIWIVGSWITGGTAYGHLVLVRLSIGGSLCLLSLLGLPEASARVIPSIVMQDVDGLLLASICLDCDKGAARMKFTRVVVSLFFWHAHAYESAHDTTRRSANGSTA